MSDEKTPRPWEAMEPDPNGGVDVCSWGVEPFKTLGTFNPADADLIVTAVNQHDALVAFVERVRDALRAVEASRNAHYSRRDREKSFEEQGWRQGAGDALNSVRATFYPILADLDAQIGGN